MIPIHSIIGHMLRGMKNQVPQAIELAEKFIFILCHQLTEMLYHGHPIHKWHNKGSVHQAAFYHPYAMPLQIAVILPKLSQLPSAFCIQRFFYNHSVPHNDSTQRILFSPFR